MSTLANLIAEQKDLDARIAAAKAEAVAEILGQMNVLGITVADLAKSMTSSHKAGSKRPIKYRDTGGNTWTGVGQRPRWLRAAMAAGATLESFSVKD